MFAASLLKEGHGLGEITQRQIAETRQLITEKWEPYKLLDGISGVLKENVATLLENQANYMLTEGANSTSAGSFEAMAFPMIRRTFQRLVANDLVSVQSLVQPVGRVYFYNPKISKRSAATTSNGITSEGHTSLPGIASNEAAKFTVDASGRKVLSPVDYGKLVAKPGETLTPAYEQASLYDRFYATEYDNYGESIFDRTRGRRITVSKTATIVGYTPGTSKVLVAITGFTVPTTGRLRGPMGQLADTEEFTSSLRITPGEDLRIANDGTDKVVKKANVDTLRANLPAQQYGKAIVDVNGNIAIEVDLTVIDERGQYVSLAPLTTGGADLTLNAVYYSYQDMEGEGEQAEINLDLDFVNIAVGPDRMLRATYTPQLKQDIHAFHSIDIEAEMTALMSEVVSGEIDREILRDLALDAAFSRNWNYGLFETMRNNVAVNGGVMAITKKEYSQELVMVINEVSANIQKATMSKGASWLVVSPEISALFYNLENFHVTAKFGEDGTADSEYSMGIDKVGSLNARFKVYVDTQAPAGLLLMGNKGDSVFKSGYLYCPYVPLMLFPAIQSPTDRKTVMHVMSRYGKKLVNNRYFGKVYVDGLHALDVSRFIGTV